MIGNVRRKREREREKFSSMSKCFSTVFQIFASVLLNITFLNHFHSSLDKIMCSNCGQGKCALCDNDCCSLIENNFAASPVYTSFAKSYLVCSECLASTSVNQREDGFYGYVCNVAFYDKLVESYKAQRDFAISVVEEASADRKNLKKRMREEQEKEQQEEEAVDEADSEAAEEPNKKKAKKLETSEQNIIDLHKKPFGDRVTWTPERIQQIRDAIEEEPSALPCSSVGTECSNPEADIRLLPRDCEWIYHNCQKRCLSHTINDTVNNPKLVALPPLDEPSKKKKKK